MRTTRFGAVCAASLLLAACGSDEQEADIAPIAAAPSAVAVPGASHGGTVVAAGPQQVEVVPSQDGTVSAYVVSPEPPPPGQTQITVQVPANDGQTHPVMLVWDPAQQRYLGRLRRVHPVAGPVQVTVVVDGQRYQGSAPQLVVVNAAPPPPPNVRVNAPARPRRTNVVVEAPRPRPGVNVIVQGPQPPRPQVDVVLAAPPPPPGVVVVGPRPRRPGVVIAAPPGPPGVVVVEGRERHHHDHDRHHGRHRGWGRGHGHGHGRGHRHH